MVADDLVVKRHGDKNLDMYLLMLAHLVSKVDPTGKTFNPCSVVKTRILQEF